jgi:hypothetical protein
MSTIQRRLDGLPIDQKTLLYGAALVNFELLLVFAYLAIVQPTVTRWLFYVYPFIWINLSLWAISRISSPAAVGLRLWVARLLAIGYFLLLGYFGGLYGSTNSIPVGLRLELTALPPGWAPAIIYGGELFQVALLPFKLIGYLVLAYLVYVAILDATGGVAGGVLGLFSCVSCTLPVIAGVLSGFAGGASGVATAAYTQSYPLSTAVFAVTVGLLVWRPTIADVQALLPSRNQEH